MATTWFKGLTLPLPYCLHISNHFDVDVLKRAAGLLLIYATIPTLHSRNVGAGLSTPAPIWLI